jgi:hypothetical protein
MNVIGVRYKDNLPHTNYPFFSNDVLQTGEKHLSLTDNPPNIFVSNWHIICLKYKSDITRWRFGETDTSLVNIY